DPHALAVLLPTGHRGGPAVPGLRGGVPQPLGGDPGRAVVVVRYPRVGSRARGGIGEQGPAPMATIEHAPGELDAGDAAAHGEIVPSAHDAHESHDGTGLANPKLGMWLFLSSDCLFFGAFISTFLLYRDKSGQKGPTPKDVFNIPFTSVTSFILLMSSLTMVLALAAIQRGDYRRLRIWLLATAMFGATFVGGQVFEFTEFTRKGLNIDTNLF